MKEYSISFKNGDEEHSSSVRVIKDICKEYKEEEIEQVFYKTYKKIDGFWSEEDCVLLYCIYQNINNGIKFKVKESEE